MNRITDRGIRDGVNAVTVSCYGFRSRGVDRMFGGFEIRGIDRRDALIGPEGFATRECFRSGAPRPSNPWRATPTRPSLIAAPQEPLGGGDDAADFLTAFGVLAGTFVQQHHHLRVGQSLRPKPVADDWMAAEYSQPSTAR